MTDGSSGGWELNVGDAPATPQMDPSLDFAQALSELEAIVADLEGGALGLEAALARYERGVQLLRAGLAILDKSERRIELLLGVDRQGKPLREPFEAEPTMHREVANREVASREAVVRETAVREAIVRESATVREPATQRRERKASPARRPANPNQAQPDKGPTMDGPPSLF